jgi:ATP-dependent RNA helicase HelY
MAVNMVRNHSQVGAHHILNLSFAQFQADRDVVTSEAVLERKKRELALLERTQPLEYDDSPETDEASSVEAEIALRALRPGDVVLFDASNIRGRGLVLATAARRAGIRLTVLTPSRKSVEVMARDLRSLPQRAAHIDLPVPFEPQRTEFVKEAVARLVKVKVEETNARVVSRSGEPRVADSPVSAKNMKRLRREIEQMEERSRTRAGSVSARFMDVIELLRDLDYVDDWSLTSKGETLSGIFHESDLLVVEVMNRGVLNGLSTNDLVAVLSTLVYEPRGGDSGGPTRWPSDTVRQRFRRTEKISQQLQDKQREKGLHVHRAPHGGLAFDTSAWASGKPLSRILDPELTPGDFVRSIRQLIDLLRQIANTTDDEQLRANAEEAMGAIDRGVVAAAQGANA